MVAEEVAAEVEDLVVVEEVVLVAEEVVVSVEAEEEDLEDVTRVLQKGFLNMPFSHTQPRKI